MKQDKVAQFRQQVFVFKFILSFFGGIFTTVTMALGMTALTVGAVFWVYGRDLPSHESLAQYAPPTISRIYSGQGQVIDEFAKERRLFASASEIPTLVKQAFICIHKRCGFFCVLQSKDLEGTRFHFSHDNRSSWLVPTGNKITINHHL